MRSFAAALTGPCDCPGAQKKCLGFVSTAPLVAAWPTSGSAMTAMAAAIKSGIRRFTGLPFQLIASVPRAKTALRRETCSLRTRMPDLVAALELAAARLEQSVPDLRRARARGLLPHVTEGGRWELASPLSQEFSALTGLPWTGGFVAGQLWLASRLPPYAGLASEAAAVTELLEPRADQPTTHDLGFLFWPSAILGYRATADPVWRELALRAARSLARRVLPSGLIQVISSLDDPEYRGRVIVDTLPNLVLLWWAEREGDETAGAVARSHVAAGIDAFVRPDGSTIQAVRVADDGSIVERSTINGYAADSTWARGQAWAVLGFASAFRATGDAEPSTAHACPRAQVESAA